MIKLEHVVLPSPEQMEFVIEGMRNPMNSWDKSDSLFGCHNIINCQGDGTSCDYRDEWELGENDLTLMKKLSAAGPVHSKYMRMMLIMVRITAPLYWWKEFDTYKVGTVANSCSTMHKIHAKEFTEDDFSCERLLSIYDEELEVVPELKYYQIPMDVLCTTIKSLNFYRELYLETNDKKYWEQMIQLLPSSYNQTRNVMLDYEVLKNIYIWRKDHKLDEWVNFCKWIETLPYSELITGKEV